MNSIKMNRLELLSIVKANLEKHKADFIEAQEDYRLAMQKIAADNVKIAKNNQKIVNTTCDSSKLKSLISWLSVPVSYETEYGRAIRMLELSVEEVIDVEEDIFNQLVLDEWNWKRNFIASSSVYRTMSGKV